VVSVATGVEMATAARTTKQIIQAYKAVRKVETLTQEKLEALIETKGLYKLFEYEEQQKHPYYLLEASGANALASFEELIAGVLDWKVDSGTIGEELDKVKARQIVKGEATDDDLDALRLIQPVAMTEAEGADKLLSVYQSASSAYSWSGAGMINGELAKLHGKKNVALHKETPELKITTECGAAVRELKKLAKVLRDCGNGSSTIRRELERKQVNRGLTGQSKDAVIEMMLKP
jgi:hypothetical protein